jgi:hypothetical protein
MKIEIHLEHLLSFLLMEETVIAQFFVTLSIIRLLLSLEHVTFCIQGKDHGA